MSAAEEKEVFILAEGDEIQEAPAIDEKLLKAQAIVDAWYTESVFNSPVSRNTEAFNHMAMVKGNLVEKIREVL